MNTTESTPQQPPCRYPRWVLLANQCDQDYLDDKGWSCSTSTAADAQTAASCHTSTGDPIRVSVRVAPPPAESRICLQAKDASPYVVAAHGDSVLITVDLKLEGFDRWSRDYFVYTAGAGAATPPRLPLLLLLPSPFYADEEDEDDKEEDEDDEEESGSNGYFNSHLGPTLPYLDPMVTGLMRSSEEDEDNLVVASLRLRRVMAVTNYGDAAAAAGVLYSKVEAELLLLRHGKWSIQRPPMLIDGRYDEQLSSWLTDTTVVSAGDDDDGLMCWVDFSRGLLLCNVNDDAPVFRYVELPAPCLEDEVDPLSCRKPNQNVCVTSDGTVKFVDVRPRCCCGSSGATNCRHSNNAYIIRIWTLLKIDDGMVWEMDAMVDATELWALDSHKSLPRVQLACPIVSMDEPHVIFFILCEGLYAKGTRGGEMTEWLVAVDTRSKTIRSVHRNGEGPLHYGRKLIPTSVSDYFNSSTSCTGDDGASSVSKSSTNTEAEPPPLVIVPNGEQLTGNASNSKAAASREETIFAALQEIPGLAREDMLKAYSMLSRHDSSGRMFKSLLGLPMNMRKDWLLMEITTSEVPSLCSACKANLQHA